MTNVEKAREIHATLGIYADAYYGAMAMAKWKDKQILLDDDDKLANEVKINGVTITPPQCYLIGRVTHINDSLIVELKKHLDMKTRLLKRIIDKNEMWLDLWQKHYFDLLPKITINIINKKLSELYVGWLFWEIRYNMAQEIGNTYLKRK